MITLENIKIGHTVYFFNNSNELHKLKVKYIEKGSNNWSATKILHMVSEDGVKFVSEITYATRQFSESVWRYAECEVNLNHPSIIGVDCVNKAKFDVEGIFSTDLEFITNYFKRCVDEQKQDYNDSKSNIERLQEKIIKEEEYASQCLKEIDALHKRAILFNQSKI